MTKYDSDTTQEPSGRMESVRLPVVYFILPLCLSFPTPFFLFLSVVWTIAEITDPISPQWLELDWMGFAVSVILMIDFIGFVGMCFRKEWALWLTAFVQIIRVLWDISGKNVDSMGDPDLFLYAWYTYLAYEILTIIACFVALRQCSRFKKRIH